MSTPDWLAHGGGLDAAVARYSIAKDRWLDLSTGINPHAYPLPPVDVADWLRLPDAAADLRLRGAAAAAYRAPSIDNVAAAPGSQALIQWLPRLWPRSRVAVLGPTYAEHAACWRAAGHAVDLLIGDGWDPADYDVVVAVNPNNPDGRILRPQDLLAWKDRLAPARPLLVADEAFADVAPENSLAPWAGEDNLAVLRSFGKFYGLAGARLGFALAAPALAERLRRAFGPWCVPGPVCAIAARALADDAWAEAMRKRLADDAQHLSRILLAKGLDVIGGTSLYRLAVTADAAGLFNHLASQGILVRAFEDAPDRLRFGLPPDEAAFARLDGALAAWQAERRGGGKKGV